MIEDTGRIHLLLGISQRRSNLLVISCEGEYSSWEYRVAYCNRCSVVTIRVC